MAIKFFTSQDEIPEDKREAAFETKDGRFALDEPEDTSAIRSALEKERQRAETAEKERKRIERERAEEKQRLEAERLGKTDEELKKLREDVKKELESEYAPLKDKAVKFDQLQRSVLLDTPVKELMLSDAVGVRGERQAALWKLIADRFDLTDDGKPTVKDHPGLAVDKYLTETVKKEFPEFFKGTQAAGGGAAGANGGAGAGRDAAAKSDKPPTQWSSTERAAYIDKHGVQAYRDLLNDELRSRVVKQKA